MDDTNGCIYPQEGSVTPTGLNCLQQQGKFDDFIEEFNQDRPHEGLGIVPGGGLLRPSTRAYRGLPDLTSHLASPSVDESACTAKGINLSTVFLSQAVGLKEVEDSHGS